MHQNVHDGAGFYLNPGHTYNEAIFDNETTLCHTL